MIDLTRETPFPLREARQHRLFAQMGRHPGGPLDYSTLHRYATDGHRGVKLETIDTPRGMCTTEQAIIRFFERLTAAPPTPAPATPRQIQKARGRAAAMLDAAGV